MAIEQNASNSLPVLLFLCRLIILNRLYQSNQPKGVCKLSERMANTV